MEETADYRIVTVRDGAVQPTTSWLYVWIDVDAAEVVYVGATGINPELRAHLHLTHDNPALGRVKARLAHADSGNFDVLAFPLEPEISRPRAKQALGAALADRGLTTSAKDSSVDTSGAREMVDLVARHIATLQDGTQ